MQPYLLDIGRIRDEGSRILGTLAHGLECGRGVVVRLEGLGTVDTWVRVTGKRE